MTVAAEKNEKDMPGDIGQLDVPGLLKRILGRYDDNQSKLARALDISPGTVNSWANGTRLPSSENLHKLAAIGPYAVEVWQAAVGRKVRAPLDETREQYILSLWRSFGETEQDLLETQMEAVARKSGRDD